AIFLVSKEIRVLTVSCFFPGSPQRAMSATGFGICGQKNSYSSKTKCGNWVEDRIGKTVAERLAKAPRPALGSTVEREDFVHPSTMTNNTVVSGDDTKMMSASDIKDKNRE
ncbi:unnamed protein product, partial [Ectocarpus sp. 13 AM-2016]